MLAAPRPETIAKSEEVLLEDRVQHGRSCALDDFVFQGSHCERALAAIRLGNIPSAAWLRPVRSPLDPCMQIRDLAIEIGLIVPPPHPIHSRRRASLKRKERRPERGQAELVVERSEPFLLPLPCGLTYAPQRL